MRRLKDLHDRSKTFVLDALRYSLAIEEAEYAALWHLLRELEPSALQKNPDEALVIRVLSKCWTLVDMWFRTRRLILQVKGLRHKQPPLQLFLRETKAVEEFRHYVQHLDTEVPKIDGPANPIMGTVSWLCPDDTTSVSVAPTSPAAEGIASPTLPIDRILGCFGNRLQLSVGAIQNPVGSLLMCKTHDHARALSRFIEAWLEESGSLEECQHQSRVFTLTLKISED